MFKRQSSIFQANKSRTTDTASIAKAIADTGRGQVFGFPTRAAFREYSATETQDAKERLNLQETDKLITISLGSQGKQSTGNIARAVAQTLSHRKDIKILVLTGNNEALAGLISEIARDFPSVVLPRQLISGKTDNLLNDSQMADALNASQMVIGKPGGAFVAELAATNTPAILTEKNPQEDGNIEYLNSIGLSHGFFNTSEEIATQIKLILESPRKQRNTDIADWRANLRAWLDQG